MKDKYIIIFSWGKSSKWALLATRKPNFEYIRHKIFLTRKLCAANMKYDIEFRVVKQTMCWLSGRVNMKAGTKYFKSNKVDILSPDITKAPKNS